MYGFGITIDGEGNSWSGDCQDIPISMEAVFLFVASAIESEEYILEIEEIDRIQVDGQIDRTIEKFIQMIERSNIHK